MGLSRAEVQAAVKCAEWQQFRVQLKQYGIDRRMFWLLEYVKPMDWKQSRAQDAQTFEIVAHKRLECCGLRRRQVQALNYITALSRGGLIEPLPRASQFADSIQTFLEQKQWQIRTRGAR